jgi:hypothetical protein
MWKASLCTTCKKGYMMLTRSSLYEFRYNNPECNRRLVDITLCEKTEVNDKLESEQYKGD